MYKYYANCRVEVPEYERLESPEAMLEEAERKVKAHVKEHAPFPIVRTGWKAVGPSDIREGQTRSVPWKLGDKLPYWAQWLEFWAYTWPVECD